MTRLYNWAIFALILGFALPSAWAQTDQPDEAAAGGELEAEADDPAVVVSSFAGTMRFSHLGEEQGLPAAGIYAIAQDGPGFMWFGTREGLVRYDGRSSKVYAHDPEDESSLSHNDANSLAVDGQGRLWVGTAAGGLNRYEQSTDSFVHVRADDEENPLKSDAISALFADSKGRVWVAYQNGGLGVMEPGKDIVEPTSILEDSTVVDIAENKKGTLFFATARSGVLGWDPEADRSTAIYRSSRGGTVAIASDEISSVFVDHQDRLWIGLDKAGIQRIDGDKVTSFRHKPGDLRSLSADGVTVIFEGPEKTVWVGTKTGALSRFDEKRGDFAQHLADEADAQLLKGTWITAGYISRDGVCWVGTLSKGINYFNYLNQRFSYFKADGTVTAVTGDRRDSRFLWMGTEEGQGGLYHVNRLTGEHKLYRYLGQPGPNAIRLDGVWIAAIHDDGKGTVWIGTGGSGLLGFRPDTGAVTAFAVTDDEDSFGWVTDIHQDESGILWLATWGQGLIYLDPKDASFRPYTANAENPRALSSDYLYTVVPDRDEKGILWVGTAQGGLNRFVTSTGQVTRFTNNPEKPDSLSDDNVLTIHDGADGHMWIGTYGGGLNKFDKKAGTFERFQGKGRPSTIYGILPAEDGSLWMSTNGDGLHRLDPKTGESIAFTRFDGIQSNVFGQGGYGTGAQGILMFSGVNGVTAFSPADIRPDNYAPPVVLTELRLFGEARPLPDGGLDLSYRDTVLSFRFAGMSFAAPEEISFEYKLDGLHDWIRTEDTAVNYTSLDPGDYKFHLRAIGRHGAVSETVIDIPIGVSPPPWKTWWAYTIYALIIVGLVALYVRRQRAKLIQVEREARLAFAERELELTAAVQSGFLPVNNRVVDHGFNLVGYYNAAEQCSGDWWWHEKISPTKHLVVVGDVTGHGAAPAMVTASVGTTFRVMREIWQAAGPLEFLKVANAEVRKSGRGEYMMQLVAAEFDTASGELTLYSAAGLPAVCILDGKLKLCPVSGTPLGSDEFDGGSTTIQLSPGDRFMLLTDGIPEIPLANGRLFGLRNVGKTYAGLKEVPLDQAAQGLVAAAVEANHDGEQRDDWTFVVGEWAVSGAAGDSITGTGDFAQGSVAGFAEGTSSLAPGAGGPETR